MKPCRRHYFTLTELLVVLMILILITGIAVPSLRRMPYGRSPGNIANDLKLACAALRQSASFQNKTLSIIYDPENRIFICGDDVIVVPNRMKIFINNEDITSSNVKKEIFQLYPDGSAGEREIELVLDENRLVLTLSPLTGRLMIKDEK